MISEAQQEEIDKYVHAYSEEDYAMGGARKAAAYYHLKEIPVRESILDVGCGRGEMLDIATWLGYKEILGVDPATCGLRPDIIFGLATEIPVADKSFQVVSTFDMMEHLFKEDHVKALKEFERIATDYIIIAAADFPSVMNGVVYHISHMPDDDWEALFKSVFNNVQKLPRYGSISSTWLVTLNA